MYTVKDFLEAYRIDTAFMTEVMSKGNVENVNMNREKRTVEITVRFSDVIERELLFALETVIEDSVLKLNEVMVKPVYDNIEFKAEYYPDILKELFRRSPTLAGIVSDSEIQINGDVITIELFHGGLRAIECFEFDKALASVIRDEFGVYYGIKFTGVTDVDTESDVYAENIKRYEETLKRKEDEKYIEEYTVVHDPDQPPQEIEVRKDKLLFPAVYPGSERPLWGRTFKSKPQAINTLSFDSGKVTVWGDIFSMETKVTKSGDKNIISIYITDYTGSVMLKVFAPIAECKVLENLSKGKTIIAKGD